MRAAAAGLMLLMALPCMSTLAAESVYTPTSGPQCRDVAVSENSGAWRCPGPRGYAVEFFDEGNLVGISIWIPRSKKAAQPIVWRGAGRRFGLMIEWRVEYGSPRSAILRRWRVQSDSEGAESTVQELLVLKLAPIQVCEAGAVDVRTPDANRVAQRLADEIGPRPCVVQ
jgi:hypothetical protein